MKVIQYNNYTSIKNMLGEVLTEVNIRTAVFWDMTPSSSVDSYRPFGAIYIFHLQDSIFLLNVGNYLPDYAILGLYDIR
jgi:hypothetical protein